MPNKKWKTLKYPENSPLDEIINQNKGIAAHKAVVNNLKEQPKTKEEIIKNAFEDFLNLTEELYPGSKSKIDYLSPIIFNKILKIWDQEIYETYNELQDSYFDILKGMLNKE